MNQIRHHLPSGLALQLEIRRIITGLTPNACDTYGDGTAAVRAGAVRVREPSSCEEDLAQAVFQVQRLWHVALAR